MWWIICCSYSVEMTQVIQVSHNAVKNLALLHVLEGQPYQVWVVGLHLPMFGKVTNHSVPFG